MYMFVYIYIYIFICVYIYIHVCKYTFIYIYIYTFINLIYRLHKVTLMDGCRAHSVSCGGNYTAIRTSDSSGTVSMRGTKREGVCVVRRRVLCA